jgi:hypothetical protein
MYRLLCTFDSKLLVSESGSISKEIVRLYTAVLLSNMPATRQAMWEAKHPAGHLVVSSLELPPVPLVAAMTKVSQYGIHSLLHKPVFPTVLRLAQELAALFSEEKRRRKTLKNKARSLSSLVYNKSWIGRSRPLCFNGKRLTEAANALFFESFKSQFVPMWHYQLAQGHRISRLDIAQHRHLHDDNPAARLCNSLPHEQSLKVQKIALTDKRFGIMTLTHAMQVLGVPPCSADGATTNNLLDMQAEDVAKILTMARSAAAASKIIAYNLGEETRRKQINAMCRRLTQPRLLGETDEQAVARLPKTATHLLVCVECHRVANAVQDGSGSNVPFNEIGASSCMLKVDAELADAHLRCSKRPSAAIKNAMQMEEDSRCMSCSRQQVSTAVVRFDANSTISKMRRDAKTVYDQNGAALSCVGQPLVVVPVVARAVKVFNTFYSICAYCGCICTVEERHRYGSEICCTRCDFQMLYPLKTPPPKSDIDATVVKCRYCGRERAESASGGRFKIEKSPLDTAAHNKSLPPPLRWCAFCPMHWRPWLQSSLTVMETAEVFSHIAGQCRPIFAAAGEDRALRYTGGTNEATVHNIESDVISKVKTRPRSVARTLKKKNRGTHETSKRARLHR